jgi:peptidoglycan/LPS O-acetylase OafA/YrhL
LDKPNIHKKPFKREIELDFIRGVAILMVLDFHSPHAVLFYPLVRMGFPHFGWTGVDLFFVLSGFLVGGLLIKEWKERGRIDSKQFLIRRGFKIWPQYYVFLLLMLVTGHRTLRELWGNLLNIQNYVGGVAHTWSLGVEEHAYLLLVLCLVVAARRRTQMRNLFFFLAGVVVFVAILRLVLEIEGFDIFSATHTRIDGILDGVMLAILYHYKPETFRRMQSWRWLWIALIVIALAFLRWQNPSKVWTTSLSYNFADAMGVSLLMLLYRHREGSRRPAIYRFIAWIGLYSYGIYLWHVSVVSPIMTASQRMPHWAAVVWVSLAPAVLGILIGVVFTKLVEFPALKLRERLFPRRVDSAVGTPADLKEMIAG